MSVNLHTGLYQTRPHVIHLLGREVVSKAKTPLREPWSLAGVGLGDVEELGRAACSRALASLAIGVVATAELP